MRLTPSLLATTLFAAHGVAFFTAHAAAAPQVLVNETFGDETSTQLNYFGFSGVTPQVADGALKIPYASDGRFATSNFARKTLGIGDSIAIGFTLIATRVGSPADFKLGLYDSLATPATDNSVDSRNAAASDKGYLITLRDDPGLFYSGTTSTDFTGETLQAESGGYNGAYAFANGQAHELQYVLKRTSPTWLTIELHLDGVLRNTTTLSPTVTTFDNLQFGFSDRAMSGVTLDNLSVLYTSLPVPEPTSLAALAGTLTFIGRRGRR